MAVVAAADAHILTLHAVSHQALPAAAREAANRVGALGGCMAVVLARRALILVTLHSVS
eukprot:CAMPEP_0181314996 /NCGR_PEP_ID=MMETSP1101-20121128/15128_1 /TAXON_ID=46948 /ORGANISM="Rhodomonas abbreviata, Strain Caron Lab Isolate" /LENGTH=58 /DNA_ID=CAMNT_0023422151 /DNA_START=30 /DNA_END=203 /DNA_ORIENTATION=-